MPQDPLTEIVNSTPRGVPHLDDLKRFADEEGLVVGSTTGGKHNVGSKHYSGNAFDAKGSGAFSNEQVARLKSRGAQRGLIVRDERARPKGQKVWGGPHIHVEYAGGVEQDPLTEITQGSAEVDPLTEITSSNKTYTKQLSRVPEPPAPLSSQLKGGAATIFNRSDVPRQPDAPFTFGEGAPKKIVVRPAPFTFSEPRERQQLVQQYKDELVRSNAPMELGFVPGPDPRFNDKYQAEAERRADEELAARARGNTAEVIAGRKDLGRMSAFERTFSAPALRVASGLLKSVAGASPFITPTGIKNYLNTKAQYLEDISSMPLNEKGEAITRSIPEKIGTAVTDLGFTVIQLAALQRATGLPMSRLMAIESALKTSDLPAGERAAAIAKSYGMGKILDQHLSRPVSAALFGVPTALQSTAAVAQGKMTLADALIETGVQAGAGAILSGGKGKPESRLDQTVPAELQVRLSEADARQEAARYAESRIDRIPTIPDIPVGTIPEVRVVKGGGFADGRVSRVPDPVAAQPEPTVATPSAPVESLTTLAVGRDSSVSTERGTEVATKYAIVEAPDLVTSHDAVLNRNPEFPADLQPRERGRAASADQINRIASNVRPEYLGDSPKASEGAPIVGPDGIVESGNGRVLGLRKAFEAGKAGDYRQYLLDNAEAFGIDKVAIQTATEPVLVRIRQSEVDRPQFVREANESGVASMSAPEQARSDAQRLTGSLLSTFAPSESGELNTAANTPFIQAFMRDVVGPNELGRYVSAKGEISQEGLTRIRNAIFARAYGDSPEGLRALEKLSESPDNNVRNITTALLQKAGQFASLKEGIEKGERYPLDVTSDLSKALAKLSSLREQNTTVADYLNQGGLFGDDLTPLQKQALWAFDEYKRSGKAVSAILDNFVRGAEAAGSPKQSAFFEKSPPQKEALFEAAVREAVRDANKEISLFPSEGVQPKSETSRSVPNIDTASQRVGRSVPEPDRSLTGARSVETTESRRSSLIPEPPQQNLGPGAANINEPFPEVKERSFGVRFVEDERMVQELRDSIGTAKYYEPIPNNLTAENAREFVESRGIPEAMKAIRDESNGMPFHVRVAAGEIAILRLNEVVKNLKYDNPEAATLALDQATDMAEWAMDYGTRLGQGVQAFAMWKRLTPDGKLLTYKRAVEKARKEYEVKTGDEVKEIVEKLNAPPEAREVTPEVVSEAATPAIKKAIGKRIAQSRASKKGRVPTAQDAKDVPVWQQYKDSIARQLANVAIPGKAKEHPALQEFSERLLANVEPLIQKPEKTTAKPDVYGQMREVVENFDKYKEAWNEAITFIRAKYEKSLMMDKPLLAQQGLVELNALERRITDLNSAFQTRAFDKVFNDMVKQSEINFTDLAKAHYSERQGTRDEFIVKIQGGIGAELTPEEARDLVSRIEQRLEAKILRSRELILAGMEKSGNKTAKRIKSVTEQIIEASRIGALNEQKFYELASEKLGLPKYDRAVADKIMELAAYVETAPEGMPKDKAVFELNKFIAEQKGFSPWDLPLGIYYGNILSGYNTHLVNTVDTALNVISEINGLAIESPRAAAKIFSGLLRGLNNGRLDALMALTEGRMITDGKWLEVPRLMEIARFGQKGGVPIKESSRFSRTTKAIAESKVAVPLNAYKYITRMLAASDAVFFRGAKEARASLLAYRMAKAEGATGDLIQARMNEILGLDRNADFLAQAQREGFTGSEAETRAIELREFVRDKDLSNDAADFAGEATYNHAPHGVLGMFAEGLAKASDKFKLLKLFVPFTRIVANVTNRGLNWTPYGFKRAAVGYTFGDPLTPEARRLMLTRATLGTAGLVTLGLMQHGGLLQIHGNGPSDGERRRQLMNTGWRPYSIQMGDTYISYVTTPLGLGLSILGNMSDADRYHELEQSDIGTRGAYAVMRAPSTVFNQSFLSGLNQLFQALSSEPAESVSAVKRIMSSTTAAVTTPNLVRDVYKLFDNRQYQANTLMEDLIRNTPFAVMALKPQLNAFGEPVRLPRQRFFDIQTSDPAWRFVMARGLRVPVPNRSTEIKPGRRITPEEYYSLLQTTGPQIKQWIVENQLRLGGMTEDAAQEELSRAAGKFHQQALDRIEPSRLIMRTLFRGVPRPPETVPSPTPNP